MSTEYLDVRFNYLCFGFERKGIKNFSRMWGRTVRNGPWTEHCASNWSDRQSVRSWENSRVSSVYRELILKINLVDLLLAWFLGSAKVTFAPALVTVRGLLSTVKEQCTRGDGQNRQFIEDVVSQPHTVVLVRTWIRFIHAWLQLAEKEDGLLWVLWTMSMENCLLAFIRTSS